MHASKSDWPGTTAADQADAVRSKVVSPTDLLTAHLDQIKRLDPHIGAFQLIRADKALREATELQRRDDLGRLPLAGVPVAIKDNVDVAGEPTRDGTPATADGPSSNDHEVVKSIRAAGAIVIGKTRVPELGTFGTTDSAFGITRNPWDPSRTPGGSSGGSAAAVAAAMVPIAHGNDGMGSVRIPAACCGLVGVKPGSGVVPVDLGPTDWYGLAQNGVLATTVRDAGLLLGVMASREDFYNPQSPQASLRIAISTRLSPVVRVVPEFRRATTETGELLAGAGHFVERSDPPYSNRSLLAAFVRWTAGVDDAAELLDRSQLEARNRRHAAFGRIAKRRGWLGPNGRDAWRAALDPFFERFDVLITPTLAQVPLQASEWGKRSWTANMLSNARYAPFPSPWNLAGYPAAAVPAGLHSCGVPLSVQVVAPVGMEQLVLSVSKQLEDLRPWPRHAPTASA